MECHVRWDPENRWSISSHSRDRRKSQNSQAEPSHQEEQEQEDQLEAHDEQQLQHTKEIIIVPPVNVMREKRKEEGKRE